MRLQTDAKLRTALPRRDDLTSRDGTAIAPKLAGTVSRFRLSSCNLIWPEGFRLRIGEEQAIHEQDQYRFSRTRRWSV